MLKHKTFTSSSEFLNAPCFRTRLSLTRWNADWKSATLLYEQAGTYVLRNFKPIMLDGDLFLDTVSVVANGFRIAKDYEKAKDALEKASKGQELISSYPHSLTDLIS